MPHIADPKACYLIFEMFTTPRHPSMHSLVLSSSPSDAESLDRWIRIQWISGVNCKEQKKLARRLYDSGCGGKL